MTWNGIDLTPILTALAAIVTTLLGWLAKKLADQKNQSAAWVQLSAIAVAVAGKVWDKATPVVQKAIADGKVTAEERAEIEKVLVGVIPEVTDSGTLEKIAKVVGLPMPGVIAWIASKLIEQFTQAHDPSIATVSARTFPVAELPPGSGGL